MNKLNKEEAIPQIPLKQAEIPLELKNTIIQPKNLTGNMPVPKVLLQHIFTTQREARFYQTDNKIVRANSNTVFCDVEPSKIKGIDTAIHFGFPSFKEIIENGKSVKHNSKLPRFDVYLPLKEFDEFILKYLKWRLNG